MNKEKLKASLSSIPALLKNVDSLLQENISVQEQRNLLLYLAEECPMLQIEDSITICKHVLDTI
jgi:hypothetical protein